MPSTLALFGFALLAGALPIAIVASRRVSTYRQSLAWPKVQATIIRSLVREDTSGDGTSNLPEFAFRYSVDGHEFTSGLHTEGTPFPGTEDDVRQLLQRFPVGSTVQVAVDPKEPGRAILDTGSPKAWKALRLASVVAFVVGIAIAFFEMVFSR